MALSAPWLKVGEVIELQDIDPSSGRALAGKPWVVETITACAAGIRELHPQAEEVFIPAKLKRVNGKWVETKARSFKAKKGKRSRISPRAMVKRLEVA